MMARGVIVIGAGGHAHVVIDALTHPNLRNGGVQVTAIFDDDVSLKGRSIGEAVVRGPIRDAISSPHDGLIVAIGNNDRRRAIFASLEHPSVSDRGGRRSSG
jgi:FlaA1/EpsC-like NDP-sugar epimerase